MIVYISLRLNTVSYMQKHVTSLELSVQTEITKNR